MVILKHIYAQYCKYAMHEGLISNPLSLSHRELNQIYTDQLQVEFVIILFFLFVSPNSWQSAGYTIEIIDTILNIYAALLRDISLSTPSFPAAAISGITPARREIQPCDWLVTF